MKYLKYLELPHVSYWKNRWVRRVMIILMLPQELIRANYSVFAGAALWWRLPNLGEPIPEGQECQNKN